MPEISDDTPADILALVAQPQCRHILCYLLQQNRSCRLSEIARYITNLECTKTGQKQRSTTYSDVYTSLERKHLPNLREAGVITQTQTTDEIRLTLTHRIHCVEPSLRPYLPTPTRYYID
jgi:hypothetical protein